jgi:hypothetical protein
MPSKHLAQTHQKQKAALVNQRGLSVINEK